MEIVDLGETEIDEATFWEYIESMKEHYTADKVSRERGLSCSITNYYSPVPFIRYVGSSREEKP